ncbi:hypothetical protein Q5424_17760 [Conexibacter sp. JD483]|uniref:hypothetical protein n=1 Tax=unclassified Conexibacter TaxID=2627773 RepID=UPI002727D10A|nr:MULTISPECIES: hypothetical protein [unclassified Conexibacter]MDO8188732.1 hypothetical protein [Conexibacter sp. CPCC 205706]MDO8201259.1 hypothetical protein [Conexibacter sp. CPCC 205762]MDR9370947.1 hypothetical protein [Conexibacter sp. JD483]
MPSRTLCATLVALATTAAELPAPAAATMLVYRDGNDVWAASPDGAIKQRVTSDGRADLYYAFPSGDDAGTITAIKGFSTNRVIWTLPRGAAGPTVNVMPWRISGGVNIGPLWARVKPTIGSQLAYTYFLNHGVCSGCGLEERVAVVNPAAPGSPTMPAVDQPANSRPTWFGDRLVTARGGAIWFETQPLQFSSWLSDPNNPILTGAEVDRAGTRLLVTRSDGRVVYAHWRGTVGSTSGSVTAQCLLPSATVEWAALSPDGAQVAWSDGSGLRVATVGATGATTCATSGTVLLSATGTTPAFSTATLTLPRDPDPGRREPQDPGRDPADPGRDPTDPGRDPADPGRDPTDPGEQPADPGRTPTDVGRVPTGPGDLPQRRPELTPTGAVTVAVARSARASALRGGLRVTVSAPAAGRLAATLTLKPAGRGARSVRAAGATVTLAAPGRRAFTLKPSRAAARQLRRGARLTLRIAFAPASGRAVVRTTTVTVR